MGRYRLRPAHRAALRQRKGQNGAIPWTPADLPNLVWRVVLSTGTYKDAAKTTPAADDGDVLGAVVDGVSGWDVLQGTTGNKPTLQTITNNGKTFRVARFDGLDDYLVSAACNACRNLGGATLVAILQTADMAASFYNLMVNSGGVLGSVRAGLGRELSQDRSVRAVGRRLDGNSAESAESAAGAFVAGQWGVQIGLFDWANAILTTRYGGAVVATDDPFESPGNTSDTASNGIGLGAQSSGANPMSGEVAEAFLVHRVMDAAELALLATYASVTYGIA